MGIKFNENGIFFRSMTTLANLVFYNLLWIVFCIPVFTVGAATTALLSAQFDLMQVRGPTGFRCFWGHFRRTFRSATCTWLIMVAIILFLFVDFAAASNLPMPAQQLALIFCYISTLVFLFLSVFLFPLISQSQLSGKQLLSTSFRCCIAYFPRTICLVLLAAVPFFYVFALPPFWALALSPIWLFVGFSLLSNLSARLLLPVFFADREED